MRIVSLGEDSVCRHYRSYAPALALGQRGHQIAICPSAGRGHPRENDNPRELADADVILGYRMIFNNARAVQAAVARGAAFVWDTDDDLGQAPRDSELYKTVGVQGIGHLVDRMTRLARLADIVTTTTTQLAKKYQRLGARRVAVIPNYLPREALAVRRPNPGGDVVIGWVAAAEHRSDAKRVSLVKALRRLLAAYPHVRVESVGVELPLPADRYRHRSWIDLRQLPQVLATWDLGLAPLADTPFNRARSDVKLKEYGGAGLPWLASPVGPYIDKGEEQGGRLVADWDWYDALEQLVVDDDARTQLGAGARAWAETQTIDDGVHLWESVCEEALRRRANRAAASG